MIIITITSSSSSFSCSCALKPHHEALDQAGACALHNPSSISARCWRSGPRQCKKEAPRASLSPRALRLCASLTQPSRLETKQCELGRASRQVLAVPCYGPRMLDSVDRAMRRPAPSITQALHVVHPHAYMAVWLSVYLARWLAATDASSAAGGLCSLSRLSPSPSPVRAPLPLSVCYIVCCCCSTTASRPQLRWPPWAPIVVCMPYHLSAVHLPPCLSREYATARPALDCVPASALLLRLVRR